MATQQPAYSPEEFRTATVPAGDTLVIRLKQQDVVLTVKPATAGLSALALATIGAWNTNLADSSAAVAITPGGTKDPSGELLTAQTLGDGVSGSLRISDGYDAVTLTPTGAPVVVTWRIAAPMITQER